jgi:hypothetical protein
VAQASASISALRVDEPAGDVVGAVAADSAGVGVENVDAVEFDLEHDLGGGEQVDVGFAEDDEEVALGSRNGPEGSRQKTSGLIDTSLGSEYACLRYFITDVGSHRRGTTNSTTAGRQ